MRRRPTGHGRDPARIRRKHVPWMAALLTAATAPGAPEGDAGSPPWGYQGHEMATRAAVGILPGEVPSFFREAGDQLAFLSPEPDRWRDRRQTEMHSAWEFDHYVDLENIPPGALDAPDRFAFLQALDDAGVSVREGGLLLFRIVELQQRLTSEWRRWHREDDPRIRGFIEARIIDDAGILSHYVTDASQPHHTTIHFNGWAATAPNPEGFSREPGFHSRFETAFVDAHVDLDALRRRLPSTPRPMTGSMRQAVLDFILRSHDEVETLYRLDRDVGFDPGGPADPRTVGFAADRLADGSGMLATLWLTAYRQGRDGR